MTWDFAQCCTNCFFSHKKSKFSFKLSYSYRNMQICLHKMLNELYFYDFSFPLLFIHCSFFVLIEVLWLSACNNVNLFITDTGQGKHLLVSMIYWKVLLHWAHFFCYLTCLFCTFCAFWKKNPAEGRVLSCDIWTKKRLCGVFNLSCLIVTHFLWQCCTHMPFFGRKVH